MKLTGQECRHCTATSSEFAHQTKPETKLEKIIRGFVLTYHNIVFTKIPYRGS